MKIAAFCRELGDNTLREMAQGDKKTDDAYKRAEKSLKDGQIGPGLEADLDLLDDMVRRVEGQGLYPAPTRGYQPLPDPGRGNRRAVVDVPQRPLRGPGKGEARPGTAGLRRYR